MFPFPFSRDDTRKKEIIVFVLLPSIGSPS